MIQSQRYGHAGFRPLYYPGGPALIAVMRRAMPMPGLNAEALQHAYSPRFLEPLLDTNANVFFLMFSPGFGRDAEQPFYDAFAGAAEFLKEQGCHAVACVSAGHFDAAGARRAAMPWAVRGRSARVPSWIPGFRMPCWTHPDMRASVMDRALYALELGAHGVCFDTVINGACPSAAGGGFAGPIGCACPRCREAFARETGEPHARSFPPRHNAGPDCFFKYAAWRAHATTDALSGWTAAIEKAAPSAIAAASLLHPVQANAAVIFGADTHQIAKHCHTILAETNGLIDFNKSGLAYDAATLEILSATEHCCDIATIPWHAGPRLEAPPGPQLWRAVLGETASCGAAAAPRAALFFDTETLAPATLAQEQFEPHRASAGALWNWIDSVPEVFENLAPFAYTGLLYDPDSWMRGGRAPAHCFLAMHATLSELHTPFRVVARAELERGAPRHIKGLIVPPGIEFSNQETGVLRESGARLLFIGPAPGWAPEGNSETLDAAIFDLPAPRVAGLRLAEARHNGSPAPYMQHRIPEPGRVARALETYPRVTVPEQWKTIFDTVQDMRARAGDDLVVEAPPYIPVRLWSDESCRRIVAHATHLLPGFQGPSHMRLCVPGAQSARILTPDRNRITYVQDSTLTLEIITYAAIEFRMK